MAKIAKISEQTRQSIQRKSAYILPDNPSASGWKPNDIRKALYSGMTDSSVSLIGEINRVIDEGNAALDTIVQDISKEKKDREDAVNKNAAGISENAEKILVAEDTIYKNYQEYLAFLNSTNAQFRSTNNAISSLATDVSENYAKKSDISTVYRFKGSVNTFADLPANAEIGDV